jgi:hypothetical protein
MTMEVVSGTAYIVPIIGIVVRHRSQTTTLTPTYHPLSLPQVSNAPPATQQKCVDPAGYLEGNEILLKKWARNALVTGPALAIPHGVKTVEFCQVNDIGSTPVSQRKFRGALFVAFRRSGEISMVVLTM